MAGFKKTWRMQGVRAGMAYRHFYSEGGGRLEDARYVVYLAARLEREPDRELVFDMEPDEADRLADILREYADKVREHQRSV